MKDVSKYYHNLTSKMFIKKTEEGSINSYIELSSKSIYTINTEKEEFKLKPIIIDDRLAEFEVVSPKKYKGNYVILRHIPIFVLGLTSVRPYFINGMLSKYGKSELELLLNEKVFF